jgi:two-component system chemotaxis sensor kinase CheA
MDSDDTPLSPLGTVDFNHGLMALARALVLGTSRIRQAVTPSLFVSVGTERITIPRVNVAELIYIPAERVKRHVERVGMTEVLNYRGSIVPLIRLADALGIERVYEDKDGKTAHDRRERIADRRSAESVIAEDARQWDERLDADGRRKSVTSDLRIVVVDSKGVRFGLAVGEFFPEEGSGSRQVTRLE